MILHYAYDDQSNSYIQLSTEEANTYEGNLYMYDSDISDFVDAYSYEDYYEEDPEIAKIYEPDTSVLEEQDNPDLDAVKNQLVDATVELNRLYALKKQKEAEIATRTKLLNDTQKNIDKAVAKAKASKTQPKTAMYEKHLATHTNMLAKYNKQLEEIESDIGAIENMIRELKDRTATSGATSGVESKEEEEEELTGSGPPKKKDKAEMDTGKTPGYRSVNLYVAFSNFMLNVSRNLVSINRYFF